MANATGAFGLRPVRRRDGSPWNGNVVPCYISANYATALFIGDPVYRSLVAANQDPTGTMPSIVAATAGSTNIVYGVIVGFAPLATDLSKQYNPASTERIAYVCMDRDVVYQIRDDGAGAPTKLFVGLNANLESGTGSTTTGLSGWVLDASEPPAAGQTKQLYIVGVANVEDNSLDDYAVWEVLLNTTMNATGDRLGVATTS